MLALALGLVLTTTAGAQTQSMPQQPLAPVLRTLANLGISIGTGEIAKGVATIDLDRPRLLGEIPTLQTAGILNNQATEVQLARLPYAVLIAADGNAVPPLVQTAYAQPGADRLTIDSYVTQADEHGQTQRLHMARRTFTRTLFNTINWQTVTQGDFERLAPPQFDGWFQKAILASDASAK